jgi:branched-chain amino acid transport system substrate-binding protein
LPDNHPSKPVIQKFVTAFQGKFGDKSPVVFGAHSYDVSLLLERIVPIAKKTAKPGTPEFRKALRDALETQTEIAAVNGVYNFKPTDHYGLDARGAILVQVSGGNWQLLK